MKNETQTKENETITSPEITIAALTPNGFPARLKFCGATVSGLLKNARLVAEKIEASGWRPDMTGATPTVAAPTFIGAPPNCPTFAGFACSEMLDANGLPKFIYSPDGRMAPMREGQGDTWYSVDTAETYVDDKTGEMKKKYDRVLHFRKGDKIPPVKFPE